MKKGRKTLSDMLEDDFYRMSEVSRILKVNRRTLERAVQNGELRVHKIGRSVRISKDDLLTYLLSVRSR